jgi:hypothetical protein
VPSSRSKKTVGESQRFMDQLQAELDLTDAQNASSLGADDPGSYATSPGVVKRGGGDGLPLSPSDEFYWWKDLLLNPPF